MPPHNQKRYRSRRLAGHATSSNRSDIGERFEGAGEKWTSELLAMMQKYGSTPEELVEKESVDENGMVENCEYVMNSATKLVYSSASNKIFPFPQACCKAAPLSGCNSVRVRRSWGRQWWLRTDDSSLHSRRNPRFRCQWEQKTQYGHQEFNYDDPDIDNDRDEANRLRSEDLSS